MRSTRAAVACLVVVAWGCGARESAPAAASLQKVVLPDLSHAVPPVQDQLREGYAVLARSIDNKDTRPVDLGEAYGRMGMLLMAAEPERSRVVFLNAQALAPTRRAGPITSGISTGSKVTRRSRPPPSSGRAHCSRTMRPRSSGWATRSWTRASRTPPSHCSRRRSRFSRGSSSRCSAWDARRSRGRTMPGPWSRLNARCNSIREPPSCTIPWRSPTAAWATPRRPKRTCGSGAPCRSSPTIR